MLSDRETYVLLSHYEAMAFEAPFTKTWGGNTLVLFRKTPFQFEYVWNNRVVEKHTALHVVKQYAESVR